MGRRKDSRIKKEPQNIEQGIMNIEGKKLYNSIFLIQNSIFVLTSRFLGG